MRLLARFVPANGKARLGLAIIAVYVLVAVFGPLIASAIGQSATAIDTGAVLQSPSSRHLLGTTQDGQDVLAQLLVGTRTSVEAGVLAAAVGTAIAVLVGLIGGYYGGRLDATLTAITNVFLVIPGLPLTIVLAGYLRGRGGPITIALIIALTTWAWGARAKRVQTLSLRNRDFVANARLLGESDTRIMFTEVLPNLAPVISSTLMLGLMGAILAIAGLDFLGLGDINQVSWGSMLYYAQSNQALTSGAWWWFVPPGLAITFLGAAAGLVNFGIDEIVNPRLRVARRFGRRRAAPVPPERPSVSPEEGLEKGEALLRVTGLDVRYDAVPAVTEAAFTLRRGEILGVAGESGSGKSTLVTALLRLQRPPALTTAGSATLTTDGTPVELLTADEPTLRALRWEHMSVVFQSAMNALNPVHRLDRQFADAIRAHSADAIKAHGGATRTRVRARTNELLSLVGIPVSRATAYPHELSGGMRQRATIALALACEPDLVVMDEPTTAVDVVMQRQILAQVVRLQRRLGFAVVFITHDLSLLLEIADRIAVMYAGRIVELGPSRDLYERPRHPYTRGLRDSFPPLHGELRPLRGIPGTPPDPLRPPDGCSFEPRCPLATADCATTPPPLEAFGSRLVACLRADKVSPDPEVLSDAG